MNRIFAIAALRRFAVVSAVVTACCGVARGQVAAEYGGAASVSASASAAGKSVMVPAPSKAVAPKRSQHLVIPTGPPPEVVNRKALRAERRGGR